MTAFSLDTSRESWSPEVRRAEPERHDTVVIGGGQAGLSVGYHLRRRGVPFVILDADRRTGDVWRRRWDSLRLFTPAAFDGLDGMPFPAPPDRFPTKDEFADYLEAYAARFELPVRHGWRVDRLARGDDGFVIASGGRVLTARHVVVAMGSYQRPSVPRFAADLSPDVVQLHSSDYRRPDQLPPGDVLVVGAGNSGAEIALELSRTRRVVLAGRPPGELPFDVASRAAHAVLTRLLLRGLFHRVLTVDTPVGRRFRRRSAGHSGPLIRTKARHLEAAGVRRVGRVAGVRDGRPVLADGTALDVAAVVWCTGFRPGFEWVDLPLELDAHGLPEHRRGAVPGVPGLYSVGLPFLFAFSSSMVHGVGRDAARVAAAIAARATREGPRTVRDPQALVVEAAGVEPASGTASTVRLRA